MSSTGWKIIKAFMDYIALVWYRVGWQVFKVPWRGRQQIPPTKFRIYFHKTVKLALDHFIISIAISKQLNPASHWLRKTVLKPHSHIVHHVWLFCNRPRLLNSPCSVDVTYRSLSLFSRCYISITLLVQSMLHIDHSVLIHRDPNSRDRNSAEINK
jgi:hypothetical protein